MGTEAFSDQQLLARCLTHLAIYAVAFDTARQRCRDCHPAGGEDVPMCAACSEGVVCVYEWAVRLAAEAATDHPDPRGLFELCAREGLREIGAHANAALERCPDCGEHRTEYRDDFCPRCWVVVHMMSGVLREIAALRTALEGRN